MELQAKEERINKNYRPMITYFESYREDESDGEKRKEKKTNERSIDEQNGIQKKNKKGISIGKLFGCEKSLC